MTRTTWSLLLALFLSNAIALAQEPVTVQTDKGPVVGRQAGAVRTFLGIPYAAPPVGDLRWKAPQSPAAWAVPRDASAFGNVCFQVATGMLEGEDQSKGKILGNEDCLYLNVYSPGSATANNRLPTMVWIHGGAFIFGAGSEYDASALAQKNGVVVVTLNYRLGSLGFLALPSLKAESPDGASGNYGLLDQQAALRWVQNNIAAFGGDPGNVTLFGESAGGLSVCAQLASPAAAGLFHKAIIQSGPCSSPNNSGAAADSTKRNLDYADKLGCKNGNLACLSKIDAAKLVGQAVPGKRPLGNMVWAPVYGTALMPLSLQTAFARGSFNRVPVMIGSNHDEGRFFISLATPDGKALPLYKYWAATGLLVGAKKSRTVLQKYPYRASGTPALALTTVLTDYMFSCSALSVSSEISKYVPVYAFEFNDPQAITTLKTPPGMDSMGAFHSSGLVYIFQTPLAGLGADPAQFSPAQRQLSDAFSEAWATFAKTGDPNGQGQQRWRKFEPGRANVQVFTPSGISESTDFADDHKCSFWSKLQIN
jgi:para-nitrobenzyl esterase